MTIQEKMHTLEFSEKELAAIFFLLSRSNGRSTNQVWKRCKDILVGEEDENDVSIKHRLLSEKCGYNYLIDYYSVAEEWETFLGIGVENKKILDRITNMEKELAELKGML